ncbi:MAG: hypothetical protein ACR2LV_01975 [Solirubrobacteraceae bacterium]
MLALVAMTWRIGRQGAATMQARSDARVGSGDGGRRDVAGVGAAVAAPYRGLRLPDFDQGPLLAALAR